MQRTTAPGSSGSAALCERRTRASRAGMSPGSENAGSFGSIERAQRRRLLRERDELVERYVVSLERPGATALVQKPEPGDVAQEPERPPTPPSFVRFAAKLAVVITGCSNLEPTSDHVPALTNAELGSAERHRGDGRAGVVGRDGDDDRVAEPGVLRHPVAQPVELGARLHHVRAAAAWGHRAARARRPPRSPVRGSKHCVVVAFVSSDVRAPQSQ